MCGEYFIDYIWKNNRCIEKVADFDEYVKVENPEGLGRLLAGGFGRNPLKKLARYAKGIKRGDKSCAT